MLCTSGTKPDTVAAVARSKLGDLPGRVTSITTAALEPASSVAPAWSVSLAIRHGALGHAVPPTREVKVTYHRYVPSMLGPTRETSTEPTPGSVSKAASTSAAVASKSMLTSRLRYIVTSLVVVSVHVSKLANVTPLVSTADTTNSCWPIMGLPTSTPSPTRRSELKSLFGVWASSLPVVTSTVPSAVLLTNRSSPVAPATWYEDRGSSLHVHSAVSWTVNVSPPMLTPSPRFNSKRVSTDVEATLEPRDTVTHELQAVASKSPW